MHARLPHHCTTELYISGGSRISQTGGRQPQRGGRQHTIWPIFPKNCMKMKKIWPRGGGARPCAPPLDPPMYMSDYKANISIFVRHMKPLRPKLFGVCQFSDMEVNGIKLNRKYTTSPTSRKFQSLRSISKWRMERSGKPSSRLNTQLPKQPTTGRRAYFHWGLHNQFSFIWKILSIPKTLFRTKKPASKWSASLTCQIR